MKEEIIKELKDKKFWGYVAGMIFLTIIFLKVPVITLKIIALGLLALFQFLYNSKREIDGGEKILKWVYFTMFLFYFLIYTSLKVGELDFTIISVLIFIFAVFSGMVTLHFFNLKNSRSITGVIISYMGLSISLILLFGFLFSILGGFEDNKILSADGKPIEDTWNYISFSAFNFYSAGYGEVPLGYSKLLSFIQLLVSFIIHIIIIGRAVNSLKNN